ncbi:hypothetical protein [Streptomyces sp. NBC_00094]|uniref:hypothetical protein n=1 Tax=Streptomyces sp. NBC_00094 TaxID=2903620 RepID=UPI00224CF246|nr:hypothetical protein [Streptomyces sp. NBC_00094]MCX5395314.1 hypothetical protein [Streptomyces sp. NBC_00094]
MSACNLADEVEPDDWSMAAADDALVAIDTLAAALAQVDPEAGEVLAAVTAATATARRRLGLPVDTEAESAPALVAPAISFAGLAYGRVRQPAAVPGSGRERRGEVGPSPCGAGSPVSFVKAPVLVWLRRTDM